MISAKRRWLAAALFFAAVCAAGARAARAEGDVSQPGVCEDLVERTVREFGSIDILINNAGAGYGDARFCGKRRGR